MKSGLRVTLNNALCIVHRKQYLIGSRIHCSTIKNVHYIVFNIRFNLFSGNTTEFRDNFKLPNDVKAKEAKLCPIETPFVLPSEYFYDGCQTQESSFLTINFHFFGNMKNLKILIFILLISIDFDRRHGSEDNTFLDLGLVLN